MRQHKLVNTILLSNINTKLKTTQFKVRETRDFPFLKFTSRTLLKKKKKLFTSWTSQEIPPFLFEP